MKKNKNKNLPYIIKSYASYMSSVRGVSKETIKGYIYDLTLFFRFIKMSRGMVEDSVEFEDIDISDVDILFIKSLDISDLYAFIYYLQNERDNMSATRARKVACLKSFYKFLYKKMQVVETNIANELETPKITKRLPIYLDEHECKILINSVKSRNVERDQCIIVLFLNTGMRLSELCSINLSNIKGDTLTIIGKGDKQRTIYLNAACIRSIAYYKAIRRNAIAEKGLIKPGHEDALFLSEQKTRINKRTVQHAILNAVKNAKVNNRCSAHKLRHTAATLLYNAGVDIKLLQEILGHENIATTQIYTHANNEQIKGAFNKNPLSL